MIPIKRYSSNALPDRIVLLHICVLCRALPSCKTEEISLAFLMHTSAQMPYSFTARLLDRKRKEQQACVDESQTAVPAFDSFLK